MRPSTTPPQVPCCVLACLPDGFGPAIAPQGALPRSLDGRSNQGCLVVVVFLLLLLCFRFCFFRVVVCIFFCKLAVFDVVVAFF